MSRKGKDVALVWVIGDSSSCRAFSELKNCPFFKGMDVSLLFEAQLIDEASKARYLCRPGYNGCFSFPFTRNMRKMPKTLKHLVASVTCVCSFSPSLPLMLCIIYYYCFFIFFPLTDVFPPWTRELVIRSPAVVVVGSNQWCSVGRRVTDGSPALF